jgi:prolyl oligopeptidase
MSTLRRDGRQFVASVAGLTAASLLACLGFAAAQSGGPPPTRRDNVKETLHGGELTDPYRWLEDQNSPETRAWIEAQNKYTDGLLGNRPERAEISQRLGELLKVDTVGLPTERGGRYFFSKRRADQDLSILFMRNGATGADEVLVDPHPMSKDHTTSVGLAGVSDDGKLIAYSIREGGADETSIKLMNVDTRAELPDMLPKFRYFGISLKPDKSGMYYTRFGAEGARVYFHTMGAGPASDTEIFGKGYGPEKIIYSSLSDDGRWLAVVVLHGSSADQTEVYVRDETTKGPLSTVVKDVPARFIPDFAGDKLLIQTNWKAPKGRVLAVDARNPAQANWKEIVPEGSAVMEGITTAGGQVFVNYTENASTKLKAYTPEGKLIREVALPTIGTVSGVGGRWQSKEAFYTFESFLTPATNYRYDVASGAATVWSKPNVPVESDKFEVKQVWYASKDKTRVPMFLVYRKGLQLNGANPALLTGYGGFNVSNTPGFSRDAVLWAEHGGVYALANLRGGGEFGEEWHKAGMLDRKQNVFDDFYGAAEFLIASKYTSAKKLAVAGGSNGGLLVGAALTQRPELFGAVVCFYPLLDMLRYQNFLVAKFWVPEYGSSENAEQFKVLRAYSPYHNVKAGVKYPAVLFVTGDADTRVAPLHARKMAALVQASTGSDKPVLLKYDVKSGHSGGRPVSKIIEDTADEMSFLFWQLGMEK